ncbi:hypothetical protein CYMTET_35150, partial [Cymbomonas tetramitiformis]
QLLRFAEMLRVGSSLLFAGVVVVLSLTASNAENDVLVLSNKYDDFKSNRTTYYDNGVVVEYYDSTSQKECSESFMLVPAVNLWPREFLPLVYFVALCYMFLGIAIVSDVFMEAIEKITSQEKTATLTDGTKVTVKIWNATIANLTLMALGSSAPEILLASIETAQNLDRQPGELGPSTIVGSAAFNLLAISAVCIYCIPTGEVRRIADLPVFLITASWSVWAYLWMLIVLTVWTPGVVTIPEAVITLLYFPTFVSLAYCQDQNWWMEKEPKVPEKMETNELSDVNLDGSHHGGALVCLDIQPGPADGPTTEQQQKTEVKSMLKLLGVTEEKGIARMRAGSVAKIEKLAQTVSSAIAQKSNVQGKATSSMFRMNARKMIAGKRFMTGLFRKEKAPAFDVDATNEILDESTMEMETMDEMQQKKGAEVGTIEFSSSEYSVMENAGKVSLIVKRTGCLTAETYVDFFTSNGTATAGKDYNSEFGTIHFKPNQLQHRINVTIIDDDEPGPDQTFCVHLTQPNMKPRDIEPDPRFSLGAYSLAQVVIIDDDDPGCFAFSESVYTVSETQETVTITVVRAGGANGTVTVEYRTSEGSAMGGVDYQEVKGTLTFAPGELEKSFTVGILTEESAEPDQTFHVHLANPTGLATMGKKNVAMVKVTHDDSLVELNRQVRELLEKRKNLFFLSSKSWSQQFEEAMSPGGSVDENGNDTPPGPTDYIMHFLTFGWKVVFALIPPTTFWNGWVTFFVSLIFIGALTAVVGEFASLLGCTLGLKDSVTAITLVALGTSLPDTFASKQAAVEAPDADAAIGNVTGSNSVNVFLGLGIPWVIGSVYYHFNGDNTDQKFCVPSASLGYSVLVFTCCALLGISILLFKRKFSGGELGGEHNDKVISSTVLLALWLAYVTLSSLQAYGHIVWGDGDLELDDWGCDCTKSWSSGKGCN